MILLRKYLRYGLLPLLLAGCSPSLDPLADREGEGGALEAPGVAYHREYIFVAPRAAESLAIVFGFRTEEVGPELERQVRGWLARGSTWDRFLDERSRTGAAGGVWRVVPHPDLRITAGGAAELESMRFERGERRLRLSLDAPLTRWHQGGETRFRLLTGRAALGPESVSGPILEVLRIERMLEDGWPASEDFDALFLTSGDSLHLVLAETLSAEGAAPQFAWIRTPAGERSFDRAEIRWLEMRTFDEARREIPRTWTLRVPEADLEGEIEAIGSDVTLGPERGGRRAVEIRYSVAGWVELDGVRREVAGFIRHTQR